MEDLPEPDSIYTEYHPSSGRAPMIRPLHEHGHRLFPDMLVPEKRPWEPFRTRLDFEILEFAMEIGLNRKQLSRYIDLIHNASRTASNDEEKFTVQSATEAVKLWDLAASRRVSVSKFLRFGSFKLRVSESFGSSSGQKLSSSSTSMSRSLAALNLSTVTPGIGPYRVSGIPVSRII